MNTGITDNSTAITYSLISRPHTLDGLFSTRKHISKMAVVHEKAQGSIISYRVDSENVNAFKKLTQIESNIVKPFTCDIKGNKIWFRIQGVSVGEPLTFNGYEILEATSEDIV